jgi:phenylacetate-CoA ligase
MLKKHRVKKYFDLFRESLSWSRDKVEAYQLRCIRLLSEHAYKHAPFYKKRFDEAGFNYENIKYLDDLKKIPPLTRKDIQENIKHLVSDSFDLNKCYKGSSSGSTGEPVVYYQDNAGSSANNAAIYFGWSLTGWQFGEKQLTLWGNPTTTNVDWARTSSKIKSRFFNEVKFPAYKLNTKENMDLLFNNVISNKCEFIYGYTNAIYLFAEYLSQNNLSAPCIKRVITTGENLQDFQRDLIEKTLCKVYDDYGCSEISGISINTIFDKFYSVLDPHVYVEYSNFTDVNSEQKKLLITDLHNKVFPFIRYENGDLGIPMTKKDFKDNEPKFSKMLSVEGRISDIITLPGGGNLVVPSFFGSRLLKQINGVKQYQVTKVKENKIILNLVINSDFSEDDKFKIEENMKEYLPKELQYDIVFNSNIQISKTGKFKILVDQTVNKN